MYVNKIIYSFAFFEMYNKQGGHYKTTMFSSVPMQLGSSADLDLQSFSSFRLKKAKTGHERLVNIYPKTITTPQSLIRLPTCLLSSAKYNALLYHTYNENLLITLFTCYCQWLSLHSRLIQPV